MHIHSYGRRVNYRGAAHRHFSHMNAARKIQTAWRKKAAARKRVATKWKSQYKKPKQYAQHGARRYTKAITQMKLTDQKTSKYANKVTNSLCKYGIMEEKIKLINSASTRCGFIATSNPGLATMGGVQYLFNHPINAADNGAATGFGETKSLDVFKIQRAPSDITLAANNQNPANTNVLEGRYMFCKYVKLQIDLQLTPNLLTNVATMNGLGAEYLAPAIFRVLLVRRKPTSNDGGVTAATPSLSRDLFLSWAGSMCPVGLVNSSAESGEAQVEPRNVLYKPVNLARYQVLLDRKYSLAFPSITGQSFNSRNIGFKRIDLNIPINQKLQYAQNVKAGEFTSPNNCDSDYALLIFSGMPCCNSAEMLSASPTDPLVQPSHSGKWRSSVVGAMHFVDS